jgi:ElaB/YqjD/DUF883 family membrane-anchored ribosome-binding protein
VDEGTRQGSPAVEDQETRSPDEIRADIDRTRVELGDTVEALGSKTDVKSQAREKVEEIKQRVSSATPSSAHEATATAKRNPLPFAIGAAVAVGFLIGRITKGD